MYKKLEIIWKEMIKKARNQYAADSNIVVCDDKYIVFQEYFSNAYSEIMNYMRDTQFLDRHKVAAIIMYAIIQTKVMEYKSCDDNGVFLANYQLAFSTGLSYMQYELNQILADKKEPLINRYTLPDVMHGNKGYKENFISMLYYADQNHNLNIIELSNILFLLENYSLSQY